MLFPRPFAGEGQGQGIADFSQSPDSLYQVSRQADATLGAVEEVAAHRGEAAAIVEIHVGAQLEHGRA